jgi:TonB-linked SusC/RagA family outer membrane protein
MSPPSYPTSAKEAFVSASSVRFSLGRIAALLLAGSVALPGALAAQGTGTVRGKITETEGGAPVASAQVVVAGTRLGAVTQPTGDYVITNVPAGAQTIRVMRIGYTPVDKAVTVPASSEVRADVSIARAATRLAEVVTTATGDQERRTFGNVVATLSADSVAKEAPVTNVNEMLQGRVSGLQVIQGAGQTGTSSSIRIRGTSSLSLTNEPLFVVDGVRFDNQQLPNGGNVSTQRINRLNTLGDEDIESIDVIKGPSAAALYGTAAANGVVVIKTKRGKVGKTQWNVFGEGGIVSQPANFESNWTSWGRALNTSGQPTGNPIQCKITSFAVKQCMIDSLSTFNPLENSQTTPFADQQRSQFGLQFSGGSDRLRYFMSGDHESEVGPYEMPASEIDRLTKERGTRPRPKQIHPNQLKSNNLRGNFGLSLAPTLTLDVSTGYTDQRLFTPFDGGFFAGLTFQAITARGVRGTTEGYQRELPGDVMSLEQQLQDQRLTGSTALNWSPKSWFQGRAVFGLDQDHSYNYREQLRGEGTRVAIAWGPTGQEGGKFLDRSNSTKYTVDIGGTATWAATPEISTRTSVGAQWFKDELYQAQGQGYNLPPGASTPNSAGSQVRAFEFTAENATYGAFIEEQIGWREKLFVTGGARVDKNSAFGRDVGNTVYPRASISYVISDESWWPQMEVLNRLRLRTAYGKAGVQPGTVAALQFLSAQTYPTDAGETPGLRLSSIGNQKLKPEVTTEIEAGADLGLFNDRVNVEATFFNKQSNDALFNRPLPPSYGAGANQFQNLAEVRNRGFEAAIDAVIVRTDPVTWDFRFNGSIIKNELTDAGGAPLPTTPGARNVEGFPLFGLWDRKLISYADANNDGIITESEIVVSDTALYRGPTLPEKQAGLTSSLGFFKNSLRLSALFDYRGDFYNQWGYQNQRCVSSGNCRAVNDPKAPLADQAASVAANSPSKRTQWGFFVRNDFIRFREMSLSYTVPERFVARGGVTRSATIILSGRNLGTPWTKYPGIDPEANSSVGNTGGGNNDFFSPPALRYWLVRVNLGF